MSGKATQHILIVHTQFSNLVHGSKPGLIVHGNTRGCAEVRRKALEKVSIVRHGEHTRKDMLETKAWAYSQGSHRPTSKAHTGSLEAAKDTM